MKTWILIAGLLACAGTHAQTVYRCGPEGREYSQTPCPQGKAVDVSDERSASQRAAAQVVAREEQARGNELEQARLARESVKPAAAVNIGERHTQQLAAAAPKAKASKKKKHKQAQETDDFRAMAPVKKAKKPA